MPEWLLPVVICCVIFYALPAAICYWSYKISDDKTQAAHDICFAPAFNVFLALPCMGLIWDHYFPTPEDPNDPLVKCQKALRKEIEDLDNGAAAKRSRRQGYAFDFIEEQQLRKDFDEYCDAMELMRTMQKQEDSI